MQSGRIAAVRESGAASEPVPQEQALLRERWALVERICLSPHLNRSTRLKELLHYVCRRAWEEGAEEIREHEIGVAVFQRPAEYDSAQDTIVRVQASQLRKRLERYFAEEGRTEPVSVELGRGTYLPLVKSRGESEEVRPTVTVLEKPPTPRLVWVLLALCVVLATACGWLLYRQSGSVTYPVTGPTVRRFWSAFSANGAESFLVLADSSYAAVQDALHRQIGIDEYVRRTYESDFERKDLPPEYGQLLRYLMGRRYTSLADAMVVRRITMYGLLNPARTSVVHTRDHSIRALQNGNHILIGSQRAIPWVSLFDGAMDFHVYDKKEDFHLAHDAADAHVWVDNRRPRPGEKSRYTSERRGAEGAEGYALVACLSNLGHNGNVLILAGSDMSSTEAAGTLLTTESFLADLIGRLPEWKPHQTPHFEVLLRTRHVESTNRGFEIIALHPH